MANRVVVLPYGWWIHVRREAQRPGTRALVVSPFLTTGTVRELKRLLQNDASRLRILTRFQPDDIMAGATTLSALTFCHDAGVELRALPRLHAKVVILERHAALSAFIGSGNLTESGTAGTQEGNREIVVRLEGDPASKIKAAVERWWELASGSRETRRLNDEQVLTELREALMTRDRVNKVSERLVLAYLETHAQKWTYRFPPGVLLPALAELPLWQQMLETGIEVLTGPEAERLRTKVDRVRRAFRTLTELTPWGSIMLEADVSRWQHVVESTNASICGAVARFLGDDAEQAVIRRLKRNLNKDVETVFRQTGGPKWRRECEEFWRRVEGHTRRMLQRETPPFGVSCSFQQLSPVSPTERDLCKLEEARKRLLKKRLEQHNQTCQTEAEPE